MQTTTISIGSRFGAKIPRSAGGQQPAMSLSKNRMRDRGQAHFAPKTPQNEPVPDGSWKDSKSLCEDPNRDLRSGVSAGSETRAERSSWIDSKGTADWPTTAQERDSVRDSAPTHSPAQQPRARFPLSGSRALGDRAPVAQRTGVPSAFHRSDGRMANAKFGLGQSQGEPTAPSNGNHTWSHRRLEASRSMQPPQVPAMTGTAYPTTAPTWPEQQGPGWR
jgi:hypothetical protein